MIKGTESFYDAWQEYCRETCKKNSRLPTRGLNILKALGYDCRKCNCSSLLAIDERQFRETFGAGKNAWRLFSGFQAWLKSQGVQPMDDVHEIKPIRQEQTRVTVIDIYDELKGIYEAKNHDYGNSFEESCDKFGLIASIVRLSDKWNRLSTLWNKEAKVRESIEDTLMDMANYCIMTVAWLRNRKGNEKSI